MTNHQSPITNPQSPILNHQQWMHQALELAQVAGEAGEVPVGA
ncbi:MAG: tRNA-specific adenosine deaminase, partial [Sphaerospermopsis kisseleviana]